MNYFLMDCGWAGLEGDWEVNRSRFPDHGSQNGVAWIMEQARERGFHTGLWISPYVADVHSRLRADHPDWFVEKNLIGSLMAPENWELLDLTHPEVQGWLAGLMQKLKDWGSEWIKLDFGYYFLLSEDGFQKNRTRVSGFREANRIVRETLGPDIFYLGVSIMGPHYGVVDYNRFELDTKPVWDGLYEGSLEWMNQIENQGIKPSVRTIQRRYFMHERIWVNHPDLLFFRSYPDPQYPPLTLEESRALCQLVSYSGGVIKLGERLVDMEPDAVAATRAILPNYGPSGRPLDLFRREFAEIWSLPVPDFPEPYHTVGFFNWGRNLDLTTSPYREMADADRDLEVSIRSLGLDPSRTYLGYEFWSGRFLGEFHETVRLMVPTHSARSVALREKQDRPLFLGTNRHLLGGIRVIRDLAWDEEEQCLQGVQEGATGSDLAPFSFHLAFYVPEQFSFREVVFDPPAGVHVSDVSAETVPVQDAGILHLHFTVRDQDEDRHGGTFHPVGWKLLFEPTVNWM